MILKLTKYTNVPGTFEVEWFTREVIHATGTEGEEGYQPESIKDTTVRVTAYSGDQVALFRADVDQYGGEIDEALLAEIQTEWVPPPPTPVAVPQSVTRFKAKAALLTAGLLDAVESLMGNENTPALVRLAWKEALEFERSSQTVAAMAAALNLSGSQLDDLFIAAAQIEA